MTHVVIALLCALAGAAMVGAGIWLVAKGVLTMAAVPEAALTFEWKRRIKVTTQVPGLAFFLIGLMLLSMSMLATRPASSDPIKVTGRIVGAEGNIDINLRPSGWKLEYETSGAISGMINPEPKSLILSVHASGYLPHVQSYSVGVDRTAAMGIIELRRSKIDKSDLQKNVAAMPFTAPAPLAGTRAGFGSAL